MNNNELGTLYVVATPIGNLEDTTFRAVRVLKEAAIIAAEDTRHTRNLLNHFGIPGTAISYHDFNKEEKAPLLVQRLREGQSVALVCDAGTPGIADPGYYLINCCIQAGIQVSPIPGASAFLAALSVSGLPTDAFVFEGYLPKKRNSRIKHLESLREETRTLIFYESPHRIQASLSDLLETFGDRRAALARELTKAFEEILRGRLSVLVTRSTEKSLRGEITLVIEGNRDIEPIWE